MQQQQYESQGVSFLGSDFCNPLHPEAACSMLAADFATQMLLGISQSAGG